jgi:hypothetical protein
VAGNLGARERRPRIIRRHRGAFGESILKEMLASERDSGRPILPVPYLQFETHLFYWAFCAFILGGSQNVR